MCVDTVESYFNGVRGGVRDSYMKTAKLRYCEKFRPTLSPKAESSVCFGPASVVEKLHSLRFGPMAVISATQYSLQPETPHPSSKGTSKGIL